MRKYRGLMRKDLLTVYRDHFMLVMLTVPLASAAGLRVMVTVSSRIWPELPPDLSILVAPLAVFLSPYMIGFVAGLGLVVEREMGTTLSLRVMPLPLRSFVGYQAGWPALFSVALSPLCLAIYGVTPASWPAALLVTSAAATTSGLLSFFLAGLARNRIQAMAAVKSLNVVAWAPAAAVFVTPPAGQLLMGWSPWYWAYIGLIGAISGDGAAELSLLRWPGYAPSLAAVICLVVTSIWTWLLARRYYAQASGH